MSADVAIREMSAADYHADPSDPPSLSSSIAHLLSSQSPAHAWVAHPKLNPDFQREDKGHYDVGTAAHALFLEGDAGVAIVDAPDWRTAAAKEARDQARANGKIPLLAGTFAGIEAMVVAAQRQLDTHAADPPLFTDGKPEQSLVWEELGGVICRARLDWLRDDFATIDDYKTTSKSANPEAYSRALFGIGGDIQAAFYIRGVEALTGRIPAFRWAVQETSPPYALSVIAPGPDVLTIARKKVEHALALWRRCLASDHWPAYTDQVCWAQLPAWEEARWLAKEEMAA